MHKQIKKLTVKWHANWLDFNDGIAILLVLSVLPGRAVKDKCIKHEMKTDIQRQKERELHLQCKI